MFRIGKRQLGRFITVIIFLLVFLYIFLIPQFISLGLISISWGILIAAPISLAISSLLVYSSTNGNRGGKRGKYVAIFTLIGFIVMASIVTELSVNDPLIRVSVMVPITVVIFLPALYLYYRMSQPASTAGMEYSQEYTSRLMTLLGPGNNPDHDVWISHNPRIRTYAGTSMGKDWKVFLNGNRLNELTPDQLDIAMLSAYFSRGQLFSIVLKGSVLVAIYVDLLLSGAIVVMFTAFTIPFLALSIAGFIGILTFPYQLSYILGKKQEREDLMVLSIVRNSEEMISYLKKSYQLILPLRPMSQKAYQRYQNRRNRMTEKRISRLLKNTD